MIVKSFGKIGSKADPMLSGMAEELKEGEGSAPSLPVYTAV